MDTGRARPGPWQTGCRPTEDGLGEGLGAMRSGQDADHPANAEAVGEHAKAGGPKGFGEGHADFAASDEGIKGAMGLGFGGDGEGEGEAAEFAGFHAVISGHEGAAADVKGGVHDFVFIARLERIRVANPV